MEKEYCTDKKLMLKAFLTNDQWNEIYTTRSNLVPEDSFGAHCGSYLRTYQLGATGYGEEKGFPPVPIGPPIFELTPTETGVKVRSIQGDS